MKRNFIEEGISGTSDAVATFRDESLLARDLRRYARARALRDAGIRTDSLSGTLKGVIYGAASSTEIKPR